MAAKDDTHFYKRVSEYTPPVTLFNIAATFLSTMVAMAWFEIYGLILLATILAIWFVKFLRQSSMVYIYTDRIYCRPFSKLFNKSKPIEVPFSSLTTVTFGLILPKEAKHIVHFISPELSVYAKLPFYKTTKKKKFIAALKDNNVNIIEAF